MLSSVFSAGLSGIDGYIVTVESDSKKKIPAFELVGLPDAAIKEAKERVRAACENSGYRFPNLSYMINLAPADRKKEGSQYDAAILTGILRCAGVIRRDIDMHGKCIVGELSLSGAWRSVRGVLSMCVAARDAGFTEFYVPVQNAKEAAAVHGITVYGVRNMRDLVDHLNGTKLLNGKLDDGLVAESVSFKEDIAAKKNIINTTTPFTNCQPFVLFTQIIT